jgi:hypothetical protein
MALLLHTAIWRRLGAHYWCYRSQDAYGPKERLSTMQMLQPTPANEDE